MLMLMLRLVGIQRRQQQVDDLANDHERWERSEVDEDELSAERKAQGPHEAAERRTDCARDRRKRLTQAVDRAEVAGIKETTASNKRKQSNKKMIKANKIKE